MTAADRPSVTDNARADVLEQGIRAFIRHGQAVPADVTTYDREAVHADLLAVIDDANRAAGRAETTTATTATTEDAQTGTFETILAAHSELYDSDCGTYFGCSCGWDNDDIGSNEGYVEHVAGLLATARTRPTREQIDRAVGEVLVNAANHPDPVAVLGRSIAPLRTKITDAVLELLRDGAR